MSAYLVLPLIQAGLGLFLAFAVIWHRYYLLPNRKFFFFLLGLSLWGIVIFMVRSASSLAESFFWERWLIPISLFTTAVFYHFSVIYTGTRVRRVAFLSLYVFCLLFSTLAFTDLVIAGMQVKPYGYGPTLGPLAWIWIPLIYAIYCLGLITIIKARTAAKYQEERIRYSCFVIAIGITLLGGIFDILMAAGLPVYPGLIIGTIVAMLLISVGLTKYRLLDVGRFAHRSSIYLLTGFLLAIPFVCLFLVVTTYSLEDLVPFSLHLYLFIVFTLLLPLGWQLLQKKIDRLIFRERYDYLMAMGDLGRGFRNTGGTSGRNNEIIEIISNVMPAKGCYLFMSETRGKPLTIIAANDADIIDSGICFNANSQLVGHFEETGSILYRRDINIVPRLKGIGPNDREVIERTRAEVIVPLHRSNNQLLGLLLLEKKLSGKPYSPEDEQLIKALRDYLSVKLENEILYRDALCAREDFRIWLDNMQDAILIIDEDAYVQFANRSARDKLGARVGEPCCDKDHRHYYEANRTKWHSGLSTSYVTVANGRTYDVAVAALRDFHDKKSIVEVYRDITEQRKIRENERKIQQELYLSRRLAAVGQLAAGVAHELNNPLTGIVGFSERLLRSSVDARMTRDLNRIHGEALRAARVVENLRDFARSWQPNREASDINLIITSTLELRAYELEKTNITVDLALGSDLSGIMVDFYQIQQVLLNLIMNAEQALVQGNNGGNLRIGTQRENNHVLITVSDNGPGISPEHLDKLFDPFFTTKQYMCGTGLGLNVCEGIITAHEGRIYVESRLHEGTTFFIELPI